MQHSDDVKHTHPAKTLKKTQRDWQASKLREQRELSKAADDI